VRILFTGASSFTGYWFVRALAAAGHEVVATFRQLPAEYDNGMRARRVTGLAKECRSAYGCAFGDDRFLELVASGPWDLLCHHGAEAANYKSPDFHVAAAFVANTLNLREVLRRLKSAGCHRVLLTGSVFEEGEGAGSGGVRAVSAYGISKGLTSHFFRSAVGMMDMALGKFVISNPFGPMEDERFTAYLMKSWMAGQAPAVRTPDYVRDNIHVSLLASVYGAFAADLPERGFVRIGPSGYVESQGAFSRRFANEMGHRLGIETPVEFCRQTEFSEPRIRINTDVPDASALGWNEAEAWDCLAAHYRQ
jgi:UDP-glucose 4-epimerase